MSSKNNRNSSTGGNLRNPLPDCSLSFPSGTKSMEDHYKHLSGGDSKTSLSDVKWHSAPAAERDDDRSSTAGASVYKTTTTVMEAAAGGSCGGWKPLQRQKVVTAAPTLEEDEDGSRPVVTFPPDGDNDNGANDGGAGGAGSGGGGVSVGGGTAWAVSVQANERVRKRTVTVRRGYSCQESCTARRTMAMNSCGCVGGSAVGGGGGVGAVTTAGENRRRWLSADTGNGQTAVNSKSMECLPSPQPASHHRTSFIMTADDRKSLDSGLDDVVAVEMADRRRGMFASTRTSVPSHLSLALPSCERRLTILSPHTHTPTTPALYTSGSSTESAWHFCTTSSAAASMSSATHTSVLTTCRSRKKSRPGMVLPRLVLPGSSDLDIFSQ